VSQVVRQTVPDRAMRCMGCVGASPGSRTLQKASWSSSKLC
jgi:hypothetical protein